MLLNFLYLPLLILGIHSVSSTYAYDSDALQHERNKSLIPFSLEPYEQDVRNMNACLQDDDLNEPVWTAEQSEAWAKATCDRYLREEAAKTVEQKEEEERQRIKSDERDRRVVLETEAQICQKILSFCTDHPADKPTVDRIFNTQQFRYWADFCERAGDHLCEQQRYHDADYFYDLANLGAGIYTQNSAPSSQGRMHLEQYNQELTIARPTKPTPSMFHNLQQTIRAFYAAGYCNDEVADFALPTLKKRRDRIVRWHLSNPYVATTPALRRTAYAYGFVDRILKQAQAFGNLFTATRYDGSMQNHDLAKHLVDLGFWGIEQSNKQHNWVRQDEFMIRVKKAEYDWVLLGGKITKIKRANPNDAQFTIGITANSPLIWYAGFPTGLARYGNGAIVAFEENNEVFKLAYNKGAIFVVPSRRTYDARIRWYQPSYMEEMMGLSHFDIPDGFGDARTYNTHQVRNWLSF